jgi:hypothetical protein
LTTDADGIRPQRTGPFILIRVLSDAINFYEQGQAERAEACSVEALINVAVSKSSRADLLFVVGSPVGENSVRIFREMRHALANARSGDIEKARLLHGEAGTTMAWLTYAASDAIRTTGRMSDRLRALRKLEKQAPELMPANRPDLTQEPAPE